MDGVCYREEVVSPLFAIKKHGKVCLPVNCALFFSYFFLRLRICTLLVFFLRRNNVSLYIGKDFSLIRIRIYDRLE